MEILNKKEPLSAGKRYEVKCQSVGARPPPSITWWLGGKQVCYSYREVLRHFFLTTFLLLYPIIFQIRNSVDENTSPDGNVTVSTLSLVPSVLEAGSLLVCQGGNPRIQDSTLESAWKLEIHCKCFIRRIIIFHIKLFFISIKYIHYIV